MPVEATQRLHMYEPLISPEQVQRAKELGIPVEARHSALDQRKDMTLFLLSIYRTIDKEEPDY